MSSTIESSFKSFITPYLKREKGLVLEEGFSIDGVSNVDFLVRNEAGYCTHLFEVKEVFSSKAIGELNLFRAFSYVDKGNKPACFVLACYNGGDWRLYNKEGSEVFADRLFSVEYHTKPTKPKKSSILKKICFVFSGLIILLCLFDLFTPLFLEEPVHISSEVGFLLCAAGVFAIFPLVYPRVKEVQFGSVKLVLVPNDVVLAK